MPKKTTQVASDRQHHKTICVAHTVYMSACFKLFIKHFNITPVFEYIYRSYLKSGVKLV